MRHRVRAAPPTSPLHRACVLQVLAWGNSIGDFVSNLTMARQGFPRMAVGAAFGGPMMNILIGIGVSCTARCISDADGGLYQFNLDPDSLQSLKISGGFLLASLVLSLCIVPASGFAMGKRYAAVLVVLYLAFLTAALVVEISG